MVLRWSFSGEMIRTGYDQNMAVSPCRIQYLYQGRDPSSC